MYHTGHARLGGTEGSENQNDYTAFIAPGLFHRNEKLQAKDKQLWETVVGDYTIFSSWEVCLCN